MKIKEWINRAFRSSQESLVVEECDWRDLNVLPHEAVTKAELDALQNEVVCEVNEMQTEFLQKKMLGTPELMVKPQSLYYFHKYIDAKFNKKNFDFDRYFLAKQNLVDRKYAEGLGELHSEIASYHDLLQRADELKKRLQKKINLLDPEAEVKIEDVVRENEISFRDGLQKIPTQINWRKIEEEVVV